MEKIQSIKDIEREFSKQNINYEALTDEVCQLLCIKIEMLSSELLEEWGDLRIVSKVKISRGSRSFTIEYKESTSTTSKNIGLKSNDINLFNSYGNKKTLKQIVEMAKKETFYPDKIAKINEKYNISNYNIIVCLQKYDVGTYKDFCSEFGYEGSAESLKTYKACKKEFTNMQKLFNDKELEALMYV